MTTKININDLPTFDMAEHLATEQDIAEYLTIVLEEQDPAAFNAALGTVARAKGMAEIAKASGLSRESLYKSLRGNAQPRFETVNKICRALGLKLSVDAA